MQIQKLRLSQLAIFSLGIILFCTGTLIADDSIDLKTNFPKGKQFRVVAKFEHSGSVVVDSEPAEGEDPKVTILPLKVEANLTYFQRNTSDYQAVRFFENAAASIELEKGEANPKLADANLLIIARLKPAPGKNVEMASIKDMLGQTELELIQHTADPLTLASLINRDDLKLNQKWAPDANDLAKFLGVQKITRSDVELQLKKFDADSARIYITGSVDADVDDISTQMEISGVVIVDLKNQVVSMLKVGIQETRQHGQIAPGFEGNSKIEIRIQPSDGTPELSNEALANQTRNRKIRQRLRWKSVTGQYELIFEPKWKMIADERDSAILRYLKDGELMAQCNVVLLPPRPANHPLQLNDFKKEVAKIIEADKLARLTDGTEAITPTGLRSVRVVVAGEEDGLAINWIYYHVATNDGRQISFVFTMAESVFSRMNPVAQQLVNEFVFSELPKQVASKKSDDSKSDPTQKRQPKKR